MDDKTAVLVDDPGKWMIMPWCGCGLNPFYRQMLIDWLKLRRNRPLVLTPNGTADAVIEQIHDPWSRHVAFELNKPKTYCIRFRWLVVLYYHPGCQQVADLSCLTAGQTVPDLIEAVAGELENRSLNWFHPHMRPLVVPVACQGTSIANLRFDIEPAYRENLVLTMITVACMSGKSVKLSDLQRRLGRMMGLNSEQIFEIVDRLTEQQMIFESVQSGDQQTNPSLLLPYSRLKHQSTKPRRPVNQPQLRGTAMFKSELGPHSDEGRNAGSCLDV